MDEKRPLFLHIENRLLHDGRPSEFLKTLLHEPAFCECYPFTMLTRLAEVNQSPLWHPEGSVWNHTLLVTDLAAAQKEQSSDARAFMWAALLHDVGKAPTTRVRDGKITAYDHDREGEKMARAFLEAFGETPSFVFKVSKLVRWHMQALYFTKTGKGVDMRGMLSEVDPGDIGLLCLCDRLGRGEMTAAKETEERKAIRDFLAAVKESAGAKKK